MNGYNFLSSFGDSGKVLHLPLSGFSFVLCKKKKPLGNARPIEDVSVTEKKIIQKGLWYFTAKEFLVKQINTEYSGDISQLKLENDWEQKF